MQKKKVFRFQVLTAVKLFMAVVVLRFTTFRSNLFPSSSRSHAPLQPTRPQQTTQCLSVHTKTDFPEFIILILKLCSVEDFDMTAS